MRIIRFILLLSTFSFNLIFINSLEEKKVISNVEDLIELVNSKDFEEFLSQTEDDQDVNLEFSLFGGDECLVPKKDAKKILQTEYHTIVNSPTPNLRFILGKCNPVLLIPGIYASKLIVEINCRDLAKYERLTTLKEIRIYCGDSVCKDESKKSEEHPLFAALLDKSFSLLGSKNDKYSSCLAYFMNYFQNENECPLLNNKSLCKKSPYIKVGFYGGTTKTESKGKCGIEGVQNIIQTGILAIDNIINIGAAKSFKSVSKKLIKMGYQEGFSLAGLANDYRRYLATNKFAENVFRSQIERLYKNTGKPVVIVAHSYGTLLTLTNLVNKGNKDLLPKIKKFVAVAPPFAGSSKLLDVFLHGMNEWNKSFDILGREIKITNYNIFGQNMMYRSLPTIMELRPLPIAAKIFTDEKYKDLGDALRERITYENNCRNKKCDTNLTPKFDKLFKGYFPIFSDSDCSYEDLNPKNSKTLNRKCFTEIYNVGECPTVLTKSSSTNPYEKNIESYCGKKKSEFYFQGECNTNNKNCLDDIYYKKGPYVYDDKEAVNYLINRYNKDFAKKIDGKMIDERYFETKEQIQAGNKKSIEYHNKISLIKDLPAPPVDTDIVYGAFVETPAAFILNEKDFTLKGEEFKKGGDDTVPTWSTLLTGFKWLYDKKVNNLKPKYKLVEYCSRLGKSEKYKLNPKLEQDFIALGCSCLNNKNQYKNSLEDCTHASMINDNYLIDYIISVVDDPKDSNNITESKKQAVKNYDSSKNYESICNSELKKIFETVG